MAGKLTYPLDFEAAPAETIARLDKACIDPNTALKAFYGEGNRVQEVFTPLSLVAPLLTVWGGGIALDPCAHENSPVSKIAREAWYGTPVEWKEKKGLRVPVAWSGKGLTHPWHDGTYCNPPFSELEAWCEKYRAEQEASINVAMLSPNRTQRRWLRAAMRRSIVVALNSVTFEGFDQSFPQGLFMMLAGPCRHDAAREYERLDLGEVI